MQIPPLAPGARQGALVRLLEAFDAIFVWSKEGGIHFWSKGATQLYGYKSSEVQGIVPHELFKTGFPCPWSQIRISGRSIFSRTALQDLSRVESVNSTFQGHSDWDARTALLVAFREQS
jgi:PAS domain-containing protein